MGPRFRIGVGEALKKKYARPGLDSEVGDEEGTKSYAGSAHKLGRNGILIPFSAAKPVRLALVRSNFDWEIF